MRLEEGEANVGPSFPFTSKTSQGTETASRALDCVAEHGIQALESQCPLIYLLLNQPHSLLS